MKSVADVFDRDAALTSVDNDVSLLAQSVEQFAEYYPDLLDEIRDAISIGDTDRLQDAARRLKGVMSTFHAREAVESAVALENAAKDGHLQDMLPLYRLLVEQVLTLCAALHDLVDECTTAH